MIQDGSTLSGELTTTGRVTGPGAHRTLAAGLLPRIVLCLQEGRRERLVPERASKS